MKIEVGKTYKNRVGGTITITGFDKSNDGWPFVGSDTLTYGIDGAWRDLNYGDKQDLVEECEADGSPIKANRCLQEEIGDRLRREEIALQILPTLITDFLKDVRLGAAQADVGESDPQWTIVCQEAFAIADVFIKVAKQS